ncbi:MAG: bifunctional tRNA (5-methylaminomethyl-2-thiouridine)(34)-methyltransferase MnmD/FAD-dependent 5-carboxymethylaminomethyl-2-thiouridine(34) oxidoreductase MnmC [Pseudomonadales bacterium]|nr:bifunctional tRNA (5-methylaminomethyl-2-thiouridine)(34)-methyltransferase MnmD/FAD-dependent 5-carboxymethylaminomethyl-2-thiouridine(34) oxidoreductase MnmC [Pseudomonadales bacterium]
MNFSIDPVLEKADIQWQESGEPFSRHYQDIYFSRAGGLAETHHVFLQANDLQQRWLQAEQTNTDSFTIAELGFGTGLNFLATWQLWRRTRPGRLRLHYISCEKYPLAAADLSKVLSNWPELAQEAAALSASYPDHSSGYHRLLLGRNPTTEGIHPEITLDLYFGDAAHMLAEQARQGQTRIDAWFLDGFAPRVNPEMWQESLLEQIRALSGPGSSLSSYSVTGKVIRTLQVLGFQVEKRKGFGLKRQMLFAELMPAAPVKEAKIEGARTELAARPRITVLGAGLAGSSTAWQLARRGYQVIVIDANKQAAGGASGNPQAVLQCRLNRDPSAEWQFNLHSYLYACRLYTWLTHTGHKPFHWHDCGVLTLASAYRHTRKTGSATNYPHYDAQVLHAVTAEQASNIANIRVDEPGVFMPGGGWLNPVLLCESYLSHPDIELICNTRIEQIEHDGACWHLSNPATGFTHQSEIVILATSHEITTMAQGAGLPVSPLRGQVSFVPTTANSGKLSCVVCASRYLTPAFGDDHSIGASYIKNSTDTELSEQEQAENLAAIKADFPGLNLDTPGLLAGRAGIRGGSQDFMPLVGQVPDNRFWQEVDGGSQHLSGHAREVKANHYPGLFVNVGHGSHGVATTALCADYLAAMISKEASPIPASVARCLDPTRFQQRKLRKLSASPRLHSRAPK